MRRLPGLSPAVSPATPAASVRPTHDFIPFTNADTEQSIPQRFEQLVPHYAQRLAVQSQHSTLTYSALNHAANRVAHAILAHRGAEPEAVVLLMTPDTPVIAAMLGILKAGKICVPLDPATPQGRVQYILRDTQAALLVTDRTYHPLVSHLAPATCPVFVIEDLARDGTESNPGMALAPDRCAYLIYTSGSTGQPKGVVKSHRTVLHEVKRLTNAFQLCADDRHTLIRALSSNGAIQDILSSILNGAAVFSWSLEHDGVRLAAWLRQHELTIYRSAMTMFRHLVTSLTETDAFPRLRLIQIGGEPVHAHDVALYPGVDRGWPGVYVQHP
jgi:non-ribosomal peptide synthetase component F